MSESDNKEIKISEVSNSEEPAKEQKQPAEQQVVVPSLEYDRYFLQWLKNTRQSLIICSYKTNFVFCVGFAMLLEPEVREQLSFWMTPFARPMGAYATDKDIYIGSMSQITKYTKYSENKEDIVQNGQDTIKRTPFDGYYIPRQDQFTGDIDCHDIVVDKNGELYFVSALFGSLCKKSNTHGFEIYWRPPWLTKTAAEDRCHLNGVCLRDGEPRYVTSVARTDIRGAWRNSRVGGGVVWDIKENKLVCADLCMPHSPRWHDNKLWVLNSGHGEFGYVDFSETKKTKDGEEYHPFKSVCFIPGYLRGLCFIGKGYAVVGKSQDRHEKTFQGLPLGDKLKKNNIESRCGIAVINMKTFDIVHDLTLEKPINEIYDVITIPNVVRPMLEVNQPMTLAQLFDFKDIE